MFLNFLQTDEEKEVFIQLAVIVAIANVEDADGKKDDEKNEKSSSFFRNHLVFKKPTYKIIFSGNESWKISALEEAVINGFMKELELSSYDVTTLQFNEIIDRLAPVLANITRLSEEDRRLEIISKIIEDGISWDKIRDISPQSARSMMIELLSVALIDEDYAPLEKVVIESIAMKLRIDADEIEEMEEFVNTVKKVYKSGLEILNN